MNFFHHEWLGFAANSEDAARMVKDTGVFYLTVSFAYLLSFIYMLWHSSSPQKIKKIHYLGISMWAFFGACLLLHPMIFSIFINSFVLFISLIVLFQLHHTSPLIGQATIIPTKIKMDDKRLMYTETLLIKMGHSLSDILKFTIINEQILWLMIFYRATVALRASFAL